MILLWKIQAEKINNIQEANLTLYFASESGDGLVRETQHVYYSSNTSIEKLVMEQLLDRTTFLQCTGCDSVRNQSGQCICYGWCMSGQSGRRISGSKF